MILGEIKKRLLCSLFSLVLPSALSLKKIIIYSSQSKRLIKDKSTQDLHILLLVFYLYSSEKNFMLLKAYFH